MPIPITGSIPAIRLNLELGPDAPARIGRGSSRWLPDPVVQGLP